MHKLPLAYNGPRRSQAKTMDVELREPARDAICPITQDPIADSALEWLPDCKFDRDNPTHTNMHLPCGHDFSAMNIVYHWARNRNVLCPICRGGPKAARLDLRNLPPHFGPQLTRKVRSERRRDLQEQRREHHMAAVRLAAEVPSEEDGPNWLTHYIPNHTSIVVTRRFAVLGQDNRDFRMPCNCAIEGDMIKFTAYMRSNMLEALGEFSVCGMIMSDRLETRFPPSEPWAFNSSTILMTSMVEGAATCEYRLIRENRFVVKICWSVTRVTFNYMVEHHHFSDALLRLGGAPAP